MTTVIDFLKSYPTVWNVLKLILTSAITIAVVTLLLKLEKRAAKRVREKRNNINLRFVESIARFVLIYLAAQWVIMSSEITQPFGRVLFQGTTVIAAIAGFAAQPVFAALICGMMLSITKPFDIGDRIELEDGTRGIVKDITLRHVTLQDIDTVVQVIPNSKLNGMKIANMSLDGHLRSIHMRFNVAYDTDIELAKAVVARTIRECPHTVPGKPVTSGNDYGPVYFIEYADSSLVLSTTVYYEPTVPTEVVKSDINTRILHAMRTNGIEIPYKYVNVVMNDPAA